MSEISDILDFDPYKDDPDLNSLINNHDFLKMSNDSNILLPSDINIINTEVKKENIINQPFIISNEDYTGPYQFEIYVDPHHGSKSPWVYSGPLNKIFILVNQTFPIDFKWSGSHNSDLFVRATPIFAQLQFQHETVSRCIPHAQATDASNISLEPHVWDHIIRCMNPNTIYQGNKNDNQHLSVIIPVVRYNSDPDRKMFKFVCKNSCSTGMNRRALEIIFTLEDVEGNVLGRKVLKVRICSCPKRDKEKEEREFHRNNSENKSNCWPYQKKRKVEKKPGSSTSSHDLKVYEFSLKVVGKANVREVYKRVYDLMAGEAARHNIEQPYKDVMSEIAQKLSE